MSTHHPIPGEQYSTERHGAPQGWSGAKSQPPSTLPGWYPDPWKPDGLRQWNGSDWTGATAPGGAGPADVDPDISPVVTDSAPPQTEIGDEAAEHPDEGSMPGGSGRSPGAGQPALADWASDPPTRPPTQEKRARTISGTHMVAAAALVLAAVVVVVVVFSGHNHSPRTAATGPTPGPSAPPTTPAPLGPSSGVLSAADLGTGWTTASGHFLTAAAVPQDHCNVSLWTGEPTAYESSFLNGSKLTTAHGSVVSDVFVAPSLQRATQQLAFVNSTAFGPCVQARIVNQVTGQLATTAGQRVTGVSLDPFDLTLAIPSQSYVVSVQVSATVGTPGQVISVESVTMFSGRYEGRLDVSWSSIAPMSTQVVEGLANTEAQHLLALSAAAP